MKQIQNFIFLFILLYGCKPGPYFKSPNDVSKTAGTVYLLNGNTKTGTITIELESSGKQDVFYEPDNFILLVGQNRQEKIPFDSIKSYSIGNETYYPKVVDYNFDETRANYKRLLFLKRLTDEKSRIGLYELVRKGILTQNGYQDEYLYYLSLPGYTRLQTLNTNSVKLVPGFENKMSSYVADCPTLADKIRYKDPGYFVPYFAISIADKVAVYKRIINEYDSCK